MLHYIIDSSVNYDKDQCWEKGEKTSVQTKKCFYDVKQTVRVSYCGTCWNSMNGEHKSFHGLVASL